MGAGRLGDVNGTMLIVDPENIEALLDAMLQMASAELREGLGSRARIAVEAFDWMNVGAKRATLLRERFGIAEFQ
jgi:glycosyltransferase involved in cell wall biosynthesis